LGTGTDSGVSSIIANSFHDEVVICCLRVSRTPSPSTEQPRQRVT
jgi:hypothetical protein